MVGRGLMVLAIACGGLGCGSAAAPVSPSAAGRTLAVLGPSPSPAGTLMCPLLHTGSDLRRIDAVTLIGRAESVARDRAARGGCEMSVSKRDGRWLLKDAAYRPYRVNVRVRAGVVVAVDDIG